jgi:hypothetical protein
MSFEPLKAVLIDRYLMPEKEATEESPDAADESQRKRKMPLAILPGRRPFTVPKFRRTEAVIVGIRS